MGKYESRPAPAVVHKAPMKSLLNMWEITREVGPSEDNSVIRGWLMDEIELRDPVGFNAWLDQDDPDDYQLRQYIKIED